MFIGIPHSLLKKDQLSRIVMVMAGLMYMMIFHMIPMNGLIQIMMVLATMLIYIMIIMTIHMVMEMHYDTETPSFLFVSLLISIEVIVLLSKRKQ